MITSSYSEQASVPLVAATAPPSVYCDPVHQASSQKWSCPMCTLLNPVHATICGACSYLNLKAPVTSTDIVPRNPGPVPVRTYLDNSNTTQEYNAGNEENYDGQDFPGEDPLAKKMRRRRRRRLRMAAGATVGLVLGAIIFVGPWGAIAGGVAGGAGARVLSKRGERKKDSRVAQSRLSQAVVN